MQKHSEMHGSKSHQNRPIFRGKARDGHIPSKSLNRKKKKKAESNKYNHGIDNGIRVAAAVPVHPDTTDNVSSEMLIVEHMNSNKRSDVKRKTQSEESDVPKMSEYEISVLNEINHVRKRIMNIQESIQSSPAMADPNIWKENCLNAILNCVNEWRSIVAYHGHEDSNEDKNLMVGGHSIDAVDECSHLDHDVTLTRSPIELSNEIEESDSIRTGADFCMNSNNDYSKETTRQLYGLIQMALQTGPLKASNPGYFKRCGVLVATMAKEFLEECIGENVQEQLRFTTRQAEVLNKWLKDATKAVDANKEPSKYGTKIQIEGIKKSKKGKKMK
jgi:hypothetical protein